ncbi:tyrosine-type recombinase/integrase [Paraburkholderia sp. CNPSo 3155]|uniref:tyrosine-type recombinase/integrase n=1 Tax=Paraburkholderia TaxID=1822464 RepID=UPI00128D4E96|nr:site-specific integrase [Paraburkholderia atlantica]MPW10861.1 tyrosine-type recombinase/integrase [Paraburkholderia atlantica]
MEHSYVSAKTMVCTVGGLISEHLVAFVEWLVEQQYAESYAFLVARQALAFGRWCNDRRLSLCALNDSDIARYQRLRSRHRSRCLETRRRELRALQLLINYLRSRGVCHASQALAAAADNVIEEFALCLRRDQGLAEVTVENYARWVRRFLVWRFGRGDICLSDVRAADAAAFIQSEAKRMRPAALKNIANALRSFFRYSQSRGEVSAGLAASVPTVATWASTPPIPRAISAEHAQRAIDSCNRRSAVGLRDRAVLLLLARLGLRACEIVRLTLDDIDWDRAQLRVRGKGGRESLLPLAADVGEAIAAYLQHGRPSCPDRHLFLRSVAPIRGLMEGSDGIGTIVRHAILRARVDAPHRGSHQFRHALAVRMLQLGASLPEIGRVLRHRSVQSTSIYAKVDVNTLRTLAMAWPGGVR